MESADYADAGETVFNEDAAVVDQIIPSPGGMRRIVGGRSFETLEETDLAAVKQGPSPEDGEGRFTP